MSLKLRAFVIISVIFVSLPAFAQELAGTLKKIKDTGAITLGHRESSVPFSYYDDNQRVIGYAMDLCYKSKSAHSDISISTSSPPRIMPKHS